MPTFQRCPAAVSDLANEVLLQHESHEPVITAGVKIDFVFAYADLNEEGVAINNALSKGGVKAIGICKKIALKERALGRGDAEIALDGRWWEQASENERRALLDHELHHIEVKRDVDGTCTDDLNRPLLKLRKHDYDFGWFGVIAARNGTASLEVKQAGIMMEQAGQLFWPSLFGDGKACDSNGNHAPEVSRRDRHGDELSPAIVSGMATIVKAIASSRRAKKGVAV